MIRGMETMKIDAEIAELLFRAQPGDIINEWRFIARYVYGWEDATLPLSDQTVRGWLVLRQRTFRDLYGIRYTEYPAPNHNVGLPWNGKSGPLDLTPLREITTLSYVPKED